MKYISFLLLLLIPLLGMDCADGRFSIDNKSNRHICYTTGINYPDTSLSQLATGGYILNDCTSPKTKGARAIISTWEARFSESYSDTLIFFLFDKDTLAKYDFDHIVSHDKVLARHYLTLDDLKNNNWTIIYDEGEP